MFVAVLDGTLETDSVPTLQFAYQHEKTIGCIGRASEAEPVESSSTFPYQAKKVLEQLVTTRTFLSYLLRFYQFEKISGMLYF